MTKNFLVDLFNQQSTMQVPAFTNFSPAHVLKQNVACGYIHRCCSTCVSQLHMGALDILVTAIMLKIIRGWCNMLMI